MCFIRIETLFLKMADRLVSNENLLQGFSEKKKKLITRGVWKLLKTAVLSKQDSQAWQ
jgi:hypothetical protein